MVFPWILGQNPTFLARYQFITMNKNHTGNNWAFHVNIYLLFGEIDIEWLWEYMSEVTRVIIHCFYIVVGLSALMNIKIGIFTLPIISPITRHFIWLLFCMICSKFSLFCSCHVEFKVPIHTQVCPFLKASISSLKFSATRQNQCPMTTLKSLIRIRK